MESRVFCLSVHAPYRCHHSGACCTSGWPIPVEVGLRPQLDEAIAAGRLVLPGRRRAEFVESADLPAGAAGILGHDPSGDCSCYERDVRRCAIHRQLGEAFLPASCRHFPRVCLVDRDGVFVTLSHYCPTAASLLFSPTAPLAIVEAPGTFARPPLEGLDARDALPPLLHPRMLLDRATYRAWERFVVASMELAATPEGALGRVIAVTETIRRWQPEQGPIGDCLAKAIERAPVEKALRRRPALTPEVLALDALVRDAVPADLRPPAPGDACAAFDTLVAPTWGKFTSPIRRYLAARAVGNWCSYQGRGLRTVARSLVASLAVVRVEAARLCAASNTPLDSDLLKEALRAADLIQVHLASREDMADRLGTIEEAGPEDMTREL